MKENNFENSKVLIVGGAGFVGANLVKVILRETEKVSIVVVDNIFFLQIKYSKKFKINRFQFI